MTTTNSKKPNKYVALVTYLIAVICLLLGLFLPFWGDKGILALQLPDLINKIANTQLVSANTEFALSYTVNIFCTGVYLDVIVLYALLYLVVTVFALIALIPIGVSTKKGTRAASVLMRIVETAAVIVTSVYVLIAFHVQCDSFAIFDGAQLTPFSYSMAIALGGSLLALIIQNIAIKKGSGVVKTLILLLAVIAVIALYDLSWLIPQLDGFVYPPTLFGDVYGISFANGLFGGGLVEMLMFANDLKDIIVILVATLFSVLVIVNFFIDIIGLSTKSKKPACIFNIIRYLLELLVAVGLLITVYLFKYTIGLMLIVIAVIALVQVIINLICVLKKVKEKAEEKTGETTDEVAEAEKVTENETVQSDNSEAANPEPVLMEEPVEEAELITPDGKADEPVKEEKSEPEKEEKFEPVQEEIPLPPQKDNDGWDEPASYENLQEPTHTVQPDVAPIPVRQSTPTRSNVYANEPEIRTTQIYTINTIYGGPVDDFMRKLTNEEKIEFAQTFIEKSRGNIGNIPDYVIGGNNRMFFSSVFIYLGRIRGLISDGLLNKMYKELNLL